MNEFLDGLVEENNYTTTQNNALTYRSSLKACIDFFSQGAALRQREVHEKYNMFLRAFIENPVLAMKILFYLRDVRGGQGERQTFREVITGILSNGYLSNEEVDGLIGIVSEYGRWDDVVYIFDKATPMASEMAGRELATQLDIDLASLRRGREVTLLAKWMPSINTSSKETRAVAKKFIQFAGMSPKGYRKTLSELRAHIDIVERKISSNRWSDIEYEKVPSNAGIKYRKAFFRHDENRYTDYIDEVKSGKKKINTGTLYPYDILRAYQSSPNQMDESLEIAWKNLPDYLKEDTSNSLVVCDTSGSMYAGLGAVAPICVSVSLALYIAERNHGAFKDHFITFSESPQLQIIKGKTFHERVSSLMQVEWGYNTDLQAVFNQILKVAVERNVPEKEMPSRLFIVSDMQFDQACYNNQNTNFEEIKKKFQEVGYEMPDLIFWNVNASITQSPVKFNQKGVALVSGCSPSIFKSIVANNDLTPEKIMLETVNVERYQVIENILKEKK